MRLAVNGHLDLKHSGKESTLEKRTFSLRSQLPLLCNKYIVKMVQSRNYKEHHVENKHLQIGDSFPTVEIQTTRGKIGMPDHFVGKWFVLFSFPLARTLICSTEFCKVQQAYVQFSNINCELIGLRVDQNNSTVNGLDWIMNDLKTEIEFPVISDNGRLADLLGLIHFDSGVKNIRAVFVVDPKGIIRALLYYPRELGRNINEIIRMIRGLQMSEKQNIEIPADWSNKEPVIDSIIVPPVTDLSTFKVQSQNLDEYNWRMGL